MKSVSNNQLSRHLEIEILSRQVTYMYNFSNCLSFTSLWWIDWIQNRKFWSGWYSIRIHVQQLTIRAIRPFRVMKPDKVSLAKWRRKPIAWSQNGTSKLFKVNQQIHTTVTEYWYCACHGWFNLYRHSRAVMHVKQARTTNMKHPCPQWDSNPAPSAYRRDTRYSWSRFIYKHL